MEQNKKIQGKIVETYAEDMVKVIEDDKSGLIKKIIHEEEAHEIEKRNLSPESKKNRFLMFMGVLFILLGLITLFYFIFTKKIPVIYVEKQFTPLIFNDKTDFVEVGGLDKDKITQIILNKVYTTDVKEGGIEGFYLTENKNFVWLRRFLTIIKGNLSLPDTTFVDDDFLVGVVNSGAQPDLSSGKDFFILLKVRSIDDIFNSLRAWEGKMFLDLHGFLGIDITTETKYLLNTNFEDGIIGNKNARILYEKSDIQTSPEELQPSDKKIVIMYVLANDNFIIITNTENAAREIMLRLATSKIEK